MSKIICKRPEVNSELTHFLTFMNNGNAFPSLDGMTLASSALTSLSLYKDTDKPKGFGFLETFKNSIY